MYSYFYGKIVDINEEEAVIDVHDVGYSFMFINKEDFKIGSTLKVFIHHVVREDGEFLVGFISKEEREVFNKLITVKGIGPRTAVTALRATNINALLNAISSSDVKFLKKLPGIGPKAASQIILDLKGKLVQSDADSFSWTPNQEQAIAAIKGLGFKTKEIEEVMKKLPQALSIEELIRECLRRLSN